MSRYTHSAPWYDALSAEPIYGVGRKHAIPAMHLQEGSRVLDVGCGTGLNFPLLLEAVGESGQIVGVDRSPEMLAVALRKTVRRPPDNIVLVEADAEQLSRLAVSRSDGSALLFDAVLFTYSLSLMGDWEGAWHRASSLARPGGRAAIVDMEPPHGWARFLTPVARLACRVGGADINARPWTVLDTTATKVQSWSLRGGHVQVRVGTL